jgi:hypothetical protein
MPAAAMGAGDVCVLEVGMGWRVTEDAEVMDSES